MKVICISEKGYCTATGVPVIPIGEVVTVLSEWSPQFPTNSQKYFWIKEYPVSISGQVCYYSQWRFATLSDIDEDVLELELVNEEMDSRGGH